MLKEGVFCDFSSKFCSGDIADRRWYLRRNFNPSKHNFRCKIRSSTRCTQHSAITERSIMNEWWNCRTWHVFLSFLPLLLSGPGLKPKKMLPFSTQSSPRPFVAIRQWPHWADGRASSENWQCWGMFPTPVPSPKEDFAPSRSAMILAPAHIQLKYVAR